MFLCEEIFASFENGESAAGLSPPNHHLTILLVIVFCWHKSGLHPFIRLDIIATPVFQLWFGVIIISMILLNIWIRWDNATQAAVRNLDYRADDYKFALTACAEHSQMLLCLCMNLHINLKTRKMANHLMHLLRSRKN
ncbi:hypothetical protein MJO29_000950 [Puccinia striiformis f. sp. tritici]|nr:hypothetical protein MJO29_000950 [Puccinia striiformis f. sp. tritici]